jgi:hypothetical protein
MRPKAMAVGVQESRELGTDHKSFAATLTALLVVVCGCSDGADGPESTAEGPDSVAEATLSRPVGSGPAGRPSARWRQAGSTIAVTLWGSSSCPPVPVDIGVDVDAGGITLTASDDYVGLAACTDDLAPVTYVVRLPERVKPSRPVVLIVQEEGKEDVRIPL